MVQNSINITNMDPELLNKTILYFLKNLDRKLIPYSQLIENYEQVKDDTIRMHIDKFIDIYNHGLGYQNELHPEPKRTLLSDGSYHTEPWTIEFYIQNVMAGKYNEFYNIREGRDMFGRLKD